MKNQIISINDTLLDLVSHEVVAEILVRLSSVYKYVGIFI